MYKVTILTICLCLTALEATAEISSLARKADINLMQFMASSRDLTYENPQRSMGCFDYYVPILNEITAQYEASYAACLSAADASRLGVDNSTAPQRQQLENEAYGACKTLSTCSDRNDSVSFFECYANTGSDNAKVMYSISANASEELAEVREQYWLIQNDEYRCSNASDRVYVESSSKTYDELQSCLQGKSPVPAPAPTTTTKTTAAPPTTTTHIDTTTPEEPTTEAARAKSHVERTNTVPEKLHNFKNHWLHQ